MLMSKRNQIVIQNLINNTPAIMLAKSNTVNPPLLNINKVESLTLSKNFETPIYDLLSIADV